MIKKLLPFLLFSLVLASCSKIDVFEKQYIVPGQKWYYKDVPAFSFNINDTTSGYVIYVVVRHNDQYQYNNLWISLGSRSPKDTIHYQNINIKLASDAKGWDGTAMDDIYEARKIISPGPVYFKTPGEYYFSIAQIMRENPLLNISSIGLRIEKMEAH